MARLRFMGEVASSWDWPTENSPESTPPVIFAALPLGAQALAGVYPTGAGTMFPFSVGIEDVTEWFWRVREWRVTINITDQESDESLNTTVLIPNHGQNPGGVITQPSSELDLPMARGADWSVIVEDDGGADIRMRMWNPNAPSIYGLQPGQPQFAQMGGLWLPAFEFSIQWRQEFETAPLETGLPVAGIELNMNGLTTPLYMVTVDEHQDYSGLIAITPSKYWQYALADGTSPVVEETTGTKLQDHRIG